MKSYEQDKKIRIFKADARSIFRDNKHFSLTSSISSNSYWTPLEGSRMYIAGKFSCPGLYENLSTNNIRRDEKEIPGSSEAFLTSLPSWRKTAILDPDPLLTSVSLGLAVIGSGEVEGSDVFEGSGGTGGVATRLSGVAVRDLDWPDLKLPSLVKGDGDDSSSSTSVRAANSPGVRAEDTANERLLDGFRPGRSRATAPVIFEML